MKKLKKTALAVLMMYMVVLCTVLCTTNASAAGVIDSGECGDNLTWVLYDDGELVIEGTGTMKNYSLFSREPWRSQREKIVKITISEGVTSIGGGAFPECSSLTSVTIPNSVTSIGRGAFSGCSGLTSITIPNSVISIGDGAFSDCSGLTCIKVDKNNPNFFSDEANVLYNKNKTMLIQYPAGRTDSSYLILDSVISIGDYAFQGCKNLTSVTIPNSVASIGRVAFAECSGLTSITIPNSVTVLGDFAFDFCTNLTSITIPNSITSIDVATFQGCEKLTSVTIPNSVASLGGSAFNKCTALTSVTIPANVTSIDYTAFSGCKSLNRINIDKNNPNYFSDEAGVWYNKNQTELIQYPAGRTDCSYSIPQSVTSIYHQAFRGCDGLISITIPERVSSIGTQAFAQCTALTSVTILSRDAEFYYSVFDDSSESFTLYGYADSTTEAYAAANGHNFVALEEPAQITGDITGDATLDITDVIALFRHSMMPDLYPISYEGNPDFTGDGTVNISDVILLFRHSMMPDLYPLG